MSIGEGENDEAALRRFGRSTKAARIAYEVRCQHRALATYTTGQRSIICSHTLFLCACALSGEQRCASTCKQATSLEQPYCIYAVPWVNET